MTDAECAVGFQANFVIVIANKYGLNSAVSRAIIKVVFYQYPYDSKREDQNQAKIRRESVLKLSKWNDDTFKLYFKNFPMNELKRYIRNSGLALFEHLPSKIVETINEFNDKR